MPLAKTSYAPENLEVLVRLKQTVTAISGQDLSKGELVMQTGNRSAGAMTADGGNVGNGTASAPTVTDNAIPGTYTFECTAESAEAGTFKLVDPNGAVLDDLITVAVAYAGVISTTISDGAEDFDIGDKFTVLVKEIAGKVTAFLTGNIPFTIMAEDVDATGGDVAGLGYQEADLLASEVDFGTGTDAEVRSALSDKNIFLRD